jgi:phosphoribosylanthranilate isomerase
MKIKVCGMREAGNILRVGAMAIDYLGFVFYPPSPRYAGNMLSANALRSLPAHIRKTGVFVSESMDTLSVCVERYGLDAIQLHGRETPDDCRRLRERFLQKEIIKAFSIAGPDDFLLTEDYATVCDYFLFDTRTPHYGGSGRPFDWNLLKTYRGATPFFLSGGIAVSDAERMAGLQHPALFGVDLNSRFESAPGVKDTDLLQTFIHTLKKI